MLGHYTGMVSVHVDFGRLEMQRRDCLSRLRRTYKRMRACVRCSTRELVVPVDQCIHKMREALGIPGVENNVQSHVAITGKQWFMEMKGDYSCTSCMDGRFHEQFKGEDITVEWGYDGDKAWYADFAGRVTRLELDSFELCLLMGWIRSGYWLTQQGQSKLLVEDKDDSVDLPVVRASNMQELYVKLKEFKMVVCVVVDTKSWLPLRLVTKVPGGFETWSYSDWQALEGSSLQVPYSVSHVAVSGGLNSIFVVASSLQNELQKDCYKMPSTCIISRDNVFPSAHFDATCSPYVKVFQAESGHYLVRPLIDGEDVGYFLVDTGASGLTITSEPSKRFKMEAFGEVHLLGVESRVQSRFVRGKEFQLGGLKIQNPIYMETFVGLASGEGQIAGICGFDLFFHCVVEMSISQGVFALFDPATYKSSREMQWQELHLLNNVPLVPSRINDKHALLILDTGAGGADVILHGRAAREHGLVNQQDQLKRESVRGFDALQSASGVQVEVKELDTIEVGGIVFNQPKCLLLPNRVGNLDVSMYSSGLLCGNLLQRCLMVLDYQNTRFALQKVG